VYSIMEVEGSWLGERGEELVGEVRTGGRGRGRVERREGRSEVRAGGRGHGGKSGGERRERVRRDDGG